MHIKLVCTELLLVKGETESFSSIEQGILAFSSHKIFSGDLQPSKVSEDPSLLHAGVLSGTPLKPVSKCCSSRDPQAKDQS